MALSQTVYVNPETAEMVEELVSSTRLTKAEILRQAVSMYRNAVQNGEVKVIVIPVQPSTTPAPQQ